jgi:phosphoribosyl-AMP cyclohydrolase
VFELSSLKFNSDGLIPAIVQDHENHDVLMMAWMNRESLEQTIKTGFVTYWSRSRQAFWVKGETSGHRQYLKSLSVDCDLDTLLVKVEQVGAACHDHYRSCFYRDLKDSDLVVNSTEKLP